MSADSEPGRKGRKAAAGAGDIANPTEPKKRGKSTRAPIAPEEAAVGGRRCGAQLRGRPGKHCQQFAGWGTQHPGSGRCKLHGGNAGRPPQSGRYCRIRRPRLRELLESFEGDADPLDLLPDVQLMRALIVDFVERYDETTDALILWSASFEKPYLAELYGRWAKQWRVYLGEVQDQAKRQAGLIESRPNIDLDAPMNEADFAAPELPEPPNPAHFPGKPKQVLDLLQAGTFIAQLGGMVDKIQRGRERRSVTLADVDTLLTQYGVEMVRAVHGTIDDDTARKAVLAAIEQRWNAIPAPAAFVAARDAAATE